jgi:hypothetical protein
MHDFTIVREGLNVRFVLDGALVATSPVASALPATSIGFTFTKDYPGINLPMAPMHVDRVEVGPIPSVSSSAALLSAVIFARRRRS